LCRSISSHIVFGARQGLERVPQLGQRVTAGSLQLERRLHIANVALHDLFGQSPLAFFQRRHNLGMLRARVRRIV
jgi:hypothetical protein